MKRCGQIILAIFDSAGNSEVKFLLLLLIGFLLGSVGASSEPHDVEKAIVYEQYQPDAEIGDHVCFTPVSAEIGGYTEEKDYEYTYSFKYDGEDFEYFERVPVTNIYGYIILTDTDGNRIISRERRHDVSPDLASRRTALHELEQELNEWVNQINRPGNLEYKGYVDHRLTSLEDDIDVNSEDYKRILSYIPSEEAQEALDDLQYVYLYDIGLEPTSERIEDGQKDWKYIFLPIGKMVCAFACIAPIVHVIMNGVRERKETGSGQRAQRKAVSPYRLQAHGSSAQPTVSPSAQPAGDTPYIIAKPREKQQLQKETEARQKTIASIIPQADQLDICTALLYSDPQQIKQNIHEADVETLEILREKLQETDTNGDAEMQEIIVHVQHYVQEEIVTHRVIDVAIFSDEP